MRAASRSRAAFIPQLALVATLTTGCPEGPVAIDAGGTPRDATSSDQGAAVDAAQGDQGAPSDHQVQLDADVRPDAHTADRGRDAGVDATGQDAGADAAAADAGQTNPWPDWVFEHTVWLDESTQDEAVALVQDYLDHDIPVGAIIIDSPWATGYSTFAWDPALYPDPQAMVDALHALGVRVLVWTVGAINVDAPGDLYTYAEEHDYFMKTASWAPGPYAFDWWKGRGSLVDFFNPEAVAWWRGLVDQTLDLGIDGWKTDSVDPWAYIGNYSPGLDAEVERLEYSHAYFREFFDYSRQRWGDDRVISARAVDNYGYTILGESAAFSPIDTSFMCWMGDQDPTFEGLQKALANLYASAGLGYLSLGSDIGGYREEDAFPGGREKTVFIRWAQLGTFSGFMENGGGGEHRPWMFDQETLDIYRDLVDLRYAMLPYIRREAERAWAAGESIMQFFNDSDFSYLFGQDVFVYPIIEPVTAVRVPLPAGASWLHYFHPEPAHAGGTTYEMAVPLSEYPVFVKAGSQLARELGLQP